MSPEDAISTTAGFTAAASSAYTTSQFATDYAVYGAAVTVAAPTQVTYAYPPSPGTSLSPGSNLLNSLMSFEFMGVDFYAFKANTSLVAVFEFNLAVVLSAATGGMCWN